jgi:hypothetical protein
VSSVDWQRVKSMFHEVLERDGEARAALLGRLRREDPSLHLEVSSLLEAHAAAGPFAEVPAAVPNIGRRSTVRSSAGPLAHPR